MAQEIEQDVLRVLSGLEIDGQVVRIREQLERKLYVRVNKVLESLGGKWTSGKVKGHVFQNNPIYRLDDAITSRSYEKPTRLGFFPTPEGVADELMSELGLLPGMRVLEPSAGTGNLVAAAAAIVGVGQVDAVEIRPDLCEKLMERFASTQQEAETLSVHEGDFLDLDPVEPYERILMNPPFELSQDVEHVLHAFQFLAAGGRLVSVMSAGVTFRQEKKYQRFRELPILNTVALPEDAFKASGTGVRTVYVVVEKPRA